MNIDKNFQVTEQFLRDNPTFLFVFGDNTIRKGLGGAVKLRYSKNTYGFITKKFPNNDNESFYIPEEYLPIYYVEVIKLKQFIKDNSKYEKILISKLGAGLANRYRIWEEVIEPRIKKDLSEFGDKMVYLF